MQLLAGGVGAERPKSGGCRATKRIAVGKAALRGFLDSSPDQRRQIAQELQSKPQSQQYIQLYAGFAVQVANTCNNY